MSKLPRAPLLEVIFELRWQIQEKSELTKYQYLIGDLYALCKDVYPHRQSLIPPDVPIEFLINNPVHRFSKKKDGYPLIQLGPGILSLNTDDENYFWSDFYQLSQTLISNFFEVFNRENEIFKPKLLFFDFFEFDFSSGDVHDYLNDNLNLTFRQGFISDTSYPSNLDISFFYEVNLGSLIISLTKGQDSNGRDGIIMKTSLQGNEFGTYSELLKWLDDGHMFTSSLFKNITSGKLYESFN